MSPLPRHPIASVVSRLSTVRALVSSAVPSGPTGRRLAVMALIDASGTGAFLAVSAVFFTRSVGLSAAQVGLGLALAACLGLATAVPIGAVSM